MLDKTLISKITESVRQQPRTIQEIAQLIDKNWRTAERYCDQIATETGLIASRTFRGGTRGALRIVYWNALEPGRGSAYQERLLQQILIGREKTDFSPFDLYQFVPDGNRRAILRKEEFSTKDDHRYDKLLLEARRQLLFFSGNLSWIRLGPDIPRALEEAARRRVVGKILTRIDVTSMANVRAILAINERVGYDAYEIRHCEQPLRAVIVDDALASLKEVLMPAKTRELDEQLFLFYRILDPEWIAWLQKTFWHLWNQSVDAKTRIAALETVKRL